MKCAGKDRRCFPSRKNIDKKSGVCSTTVDKAIAGLIAKGLIVKTPRYYDDESKHNHDSNIYKFFKIQLMPKTEPTTMLTAISKQHTPTKSILTELKKPTKIK